MVGISHKKPTRFLAFQKIITCARKRDVGLNVLTGEIGSKDKVSRC